MASFQFDFTVDDDQAEILLAFLADLPFHAFETEERLIKAYLNQDQVAPDLLKSVEALQKTLNFTFQYQQLEDQNWNAIWEASFQPIRVDDFVNIRASFHPPAKDVSFDLLINPEMAFGTGHHATTFMMIQFMEHLDFAQAKVLDYGCGTGILAILAAKLGASIIDAVDIETAAFENTVVNSQLNNTPQVQAIHGTLDDIHDDNYDIILANINRNVILASLPALKKQIKPAGQLLLSGILDSDWEMVKQEALRCGFKYVKHLSKDAWIGIAMQA